ncbi:unnamed protein product, partial [Rotaria socialis]
QTDQSLVTRPLSSLKLKDGLKFASSLLLPLALGVFTVIITFEQHNSSKQQREVDRKGSELQREQERNLTDQKYQNDRFDTYINAMAKLLEENSGSLRRNDVTSTVARVKTLNTFRQLDAHRNVQIIRFLYEAKQLTDTPENLSLDLSTAKLFNIDFRDAAVDTKLDVQLGRALSIHGAELPNGTRVHDINLINGGQLNCKHALIHGWTLRNVNVTVVMSNKSNNNCQFNIQPLSIEATMCKRINLLDKWDSRFWSYSQAEFNASMSTGVTMELRGINSNNRVVARQSLNFNVTNTRLLLSDEIRELEVFIDFTALGHGSNVIDYWFDDIKLIIIYGTYSELLRFMPIVPTDVKWAQNGVTIVGGNEQGNANNQLSRPYGVFVDDDQTISDITDGQGSGNGNETVVLSGNETVVLGGNEHVVLGGNEHVVLGGNEHVVWSANGQLIESDSEQFVQRGHGKVVAGGNEKGGGPNQLEYPTDVLSEKETNSLIICDEGNRRVVRWSRRNGTTQGEILIDNIRCWGLAMDDQRYLYVSDIEKDEVRRYRVGNKNNTLVAGGNGKGHGLSQLSEPRYLFVDREQNVYVSDYNNHRVMKWTKDATQGIIIAGGDGEGTDKTQLYHPNGIFVDILGTLYVADTENHRVMRWAQGAKQGKLAVGGSSSGNEPNQLNEPTGLSLDLVGNLYVVDCKNQRVQQFALE